MDTAHPSTREKALALNLDPATYGTLAEIGAGQEVARWFFHVGGAAGTVAKTISAYDMAVSDGLYGPTEHYVSRQRLTAMLEHEYAELTARLGAARGERTAFFAFADTVATRSYRHPGGGRGWLGVRFQARPGAPPSEVRTTSRSRVPMCSRAFERARRAGSGSCRQPSQTRSWREDCSGIAGAFESVDSAPRRPYPCSRASGL